MQQLKIGSTRLTTVYVMDTPGPGGAHHQYQVYPSAPRETRPADVPPAGPLPPCAVVDFRDGPLGEAGVNGCQHQDLLAIVIHRLQRSQAGPYACRENALALRNIEEAMFWLNCRTFVDPNKMLLGCGEGGGRE